MKRFFFFLCMSAVLLPGFRGQSKAQPKEIFNKEFKWRIRIPEGFDTVAAEQWAKMKNRGADAVEQTYDARVEDRARTIFVFRSNQFNYFESNYQPFDTTSDGDYLASCKSVNDILYGTFKAQMPGVQLDSASGREVIDGKLFQTFRVTVTIPGKVTMEALMYSRLFGNREFTVNFMTIDKEKQRVLLDAWRSSKFE